MRGAPENIPHCSSLRHRFRQIIGESDVLHMLQLRHLRLECFFLPVCGFRFLSVNLVSVLDGYFLTYEHSPGGPADSASSHLIRVCLELVR